MTRLELIDILWRDAEAFYFGGKEQFVNSFDGWDVTPVHIDGTLALIIKRKGPEFHFHSLATGKRISFSTIRDVVQPIIDDHGYALTKTPREDVRQHRFNKRLGFFAVTEDQYDIHYRIERLPHGR